MKSNKIKLSTLIAKRDAVSAEISKYWNIIRTENIVKKGYTRNYDIKALLVRIKELADERVNLKLRILCANMKIPYKNLALDCNQIDVFKLCEVTEYSVQLGMIKTINPTLKAKKGKKGLSNTEVLTDNYLKARIKDCKLEIIELKKKMIEYNDSEEIDMDEVPMYLAA